MLPRSFKLLCIQMPMAKPLFTGKRKVKKLWRGPLPSLLGPPSLPGCHTHHRVRRCWVSRDSGQVPWASHLPKQSSFFFPFQLPDPEIHSLFSGQIACWEYVCKWDVLSDIKWGAGGDISGFVLPGEPQWLLANKIIFSVSLLIS